MTWIQTTYNRKIDFKKPDPEQLIIEDIASGLSNMPRFAGQLKQFYSVAEHCIMAERQYVQDVEFPDKETCKAILMHDATEAFMCDVPTPLKKMLKDYQRIETRLNEVIKAKFNISSSESIQELVKKYDMLMLKNEALFTRGRLNWLNTEPYINIPVLENFTVYYMSPEFAREVFLKRWEELQDVIR